VFAAGVGTAGGAVGDDALQMEQAAFAQRGGEVAVTLVPDSGGGPLLAAPPAGAARTAAQLLGQGLPANALVQDEEDAAQAILVGQARSAALAGGNVLGRVEGTAFHSSSVNRVSTAGSP
jgi:hypothetical protein